MNACPTNLIYDNANGITFFNLEDPQMLSKKLIHWTGILIVSLTLFSTVSLAVTKEAAADRYSAYFNFRSLVSGGTVVPHWLADGSGFWFKKGEQFLKYDFDSGELVELSSEPEDLSKQDQGQGPPNMTSPDGSLVLTEQDHNLFFNNPDEDDLRQITTDGTEDHFYTTYLAMWSPDSRVAAVVQYDSRGVATIPLVDWLDPVTAVEESPYPMCSSASPGSSLHFAHADGVLVSAVDGIDPTLDVMPLGWNKANGHLMAMGFNRQMSRQVLFSIDPKTGSAKVIVEETSQTFIDGLAAYSLFDHYYFPLNEDEDFIWISQRDGFHNLYLHAHDGQLIKQLTHGQYPVLRPLKYDKEGDWLYFMACPNKVDPYSRHLCRVKLNGKNFQQLTEDSGRRRIYFSDDFKYFVDNHSDLDRKPSSDLRLSDGTMVKQLAEADISSLLDVGWTAPQRVVIKAPDGQTDIHTAIYFPPEFDSAKSYPVIEMIYAGPQWPIVPRRFIAGEYGDTAAALAQLGYVTVIIDSRGTQGRSKEFQDYIFNRLGQVEIPDHVAALQTLAETRPWMDLSRVGIHGKSWGGYFSLRAMLQAPNFYKVGVSSSLIADFMTTASSPVVPYIGLPEDNPEAYEGANCLLLANQLKGKLLMTIGTLDHNTPFAETMRMQDAFIKAGKDVDLVVFPGQNHWLQGVYFERWQRAMQEYFLTHLPPVAHTIQ